MGWELLERSGNNLVDSEACLTRHFKVEMKAWTEKKTCQLGNIMKEDDRKELFRGKEACCRNLWWSWEHDTILERSCSLFEAVGVLKPARGIWMFTGVTSKASSPVRWRPGQCPVLSEAQLLQFPLAGSHLKKPCVASHEWPHLHSNAIREINGERHSRHPSSVKDVVVGINWPPRKKNKWMCLFLLVLWGQGVLQVSLRSHSLNTAQETWMEGVADGRVHFERRCNSHHETMRCMCSRSGSQNH